MKRISLTTGLIFSVIMIFAQDTDRKIQFPDVEGYLTLKCDFHIHTVFSDGRVWPTIRVDEAVRDGLDAIALTEHIEYQPWKDDIPHPDRNRSYFLAKEAAIAHDLIVIRGTEITREMPPGHANALFVTDVNQLFIEDSIDVYRKANEQGAFVFWNHPNWISQKADGIPMLTATHLKLLEEGLLHGIEVVNDITFSEEALKIAIERGLTVMGTSDIHGLVDYQFEVANGGHRPICLVFAEERTEASIREALFAGRTVAWFDHILAGKEEHLRQLVEASMAFEARGYIGSSDVMEVDIINNSDARFYLQNTSVYDFYSDTDIINVEPHSTRRLQVLVARAGGKDIPLSFTVLNAVTGYKKQLELSVDFLGR